MIYIILSLYIYIFFLLKVFFYVEQVNQYNVIDLLMYHKDKFITLVSYWQWYKNDNEYRKDIV